MTVKELFVDWVEPDLAEYYLAGLLGIMELDTDLRIVYSKNKSVFMTNNRVGNGLFYMLENMVKAGLLEKNDETQFRWNASFKGCWEGGEDGRS